MRLKPALWAGLLALALMAVPIAASTTVFADDDPPAADNPSPPADNSSPPADNSSPPATDNPAPPAADSPPSDDPGASSGDGAPAADAAALAAPAAPPPDCSPAGESGDCNGNTNEGLGNGNINGDGNVGPDTGNDNGNLNAGDANGNANGNVNGTTDPVVVHREKNVGQGVTLAEDLTVKADGSNDADGTFSITDPSQGVAAVGTVKVVGGVTVYSFTSVGGVPSSGTLTQNPDGTFTASGFTDCYKCGGTGNLGAYNGLGNSDSSDGNNNVGFFNGNGNCGKNNGNGNVGIGNGNFNGNCSDKTGLYGNNNGNNNNGVLNGNFNGTGSFIEKLVKQVHGQGGSSVQSIATAICQNSQTPIYPNYVPQFGGPKPAKKLYRMPVTTCCPTLHLARLDPSVSIGFKGEHFVAKYVGSCSDKDRGARKSVIAFDLRNPADLKLAISRGYFIYEPEMPAFVVQHYLPSLQK